MAGQKNLRQRKTGDALTGIGEQVKSVHSFCLALMLVSPSLLADEALVAVAANFAGTAGQLEAAFEQASQHNVTLATGSTGSL